MTNGNLSPSENTPQAPQPPISQETKDALGQNTSEVGRNFDHSSEVERKPKTLLLTLAIVLFAAGLIFAGYQLGQRSQPESRPSPETTLTSSSLPTFAPSPLLAVSPTSTHTPSPTPDPTAEWETYTNEKYAYAVKYPDGAEFQQIECDNLFILNIKGDSSYEEAHCGPRDAYFSIEIQAVKGEPFSEEEHPGDTPSIKVNSESIVIDDVKGEKYILTKIKPAPVPDKSYDILLYKNGIKYRITFIAFNHENIFNLMLSTFKFLN